MSKMRQSVYRVIICGLFVMFHACIVTSFSQQSFCPGNLSDNIFSEGDFGSGAANVLQNNPGYAPGFIYTTQVPPDDGEYTVTNDMRLWPSVFPAWFRIGDNDIDPEGYMMVVNASFSPGIFYEKIINNICENTLYEFTADVINLIRNGVSGHILPNVSFLIDDVVAYSTGGIPQDEEWHTYGFTFTSAPGQSSLKLTLRNNAPGGIGNDLALDNISFKACGPASSISIDPAGKICEHDAFPLLTAVIEADTGVLQWQISTNNTLTWNDIPGATDRMYQIQPLPPGEYFFRYIYSSSPSGLNNPNCSIISDIRFVEVVQTLYTIRDTVCEGLTVMLGDTVYGQTGTYQAVFPNPSGCDSIVTLHLQVFPDPPIIADFGSWPTSCEGAGDGAVFIASVSGARPPFTFSVDGIIIPPPSSIINLPSGTYLARIENEYGCFSESTVVVEEGPPFTVNTIADTTIVLGHPVYLTAQTSLPASAVSWTPPEQVSCPVCIGTLATPFYDEVYVIEAVTMDGCIDRDSVRVRVVRDPVLYVPNVFTPNGDQVNDFFSISTDPLNVRSIDEVFIFDRWGGIISHASALSSSGEVVLWDGDTRYGPAQSGIYVFLIRFTLADGSALSSSGDVTLLR